MAAVIAYGRPPTYPRYAKGQPTTFNDILQALDPGAFTELRSEAFSGSTAPSEVILGRV